MNEAKEAVFKFNAAYKKEGKSAFYDPEHSPATICEALTGDYKSATRWCQLARMKGDDAVREECERFFSEIMSGEHVNNRAAALNVRLSKLSDV